MAWGAYGSKDMGKSIIPPHSADLVELQPIVESGSSKVDKLRPLAACCYMIEVLGTKSHPVHSEEQ